MYVVKITLLLLALLAALSADCLSAGAANAEQRTADKTLILYYSLTGNTRAGCEALQRELGADMVEIRDLKNRTGKWGFARAAISSLLGRHTRIEPEHPDLSPYANIIIGSPIWTGRLSIAARTLIARNRLDGKRVIIYTTTNAAEKEEYKEKSRALVRAAGGQVAGYYQVLAREEKDGKKIERTTAQIVADTLQLAPEIRRAFYPVP